MEEVEAHHGAMMRVLAHRLHHARVCGDLWSKHDAASALEHVAKLEDISFAADALRGMAGSGSAGSGADAFPRWPESTDLSWLDPFVSIVSVVLQSRFEDHLEAGLAAVDAALAALSPLFQAAAEAESLEDESSRRCRWTARSAAPQVRQILVALEYGARWGGAVAKRSLELQERAQKLLGTATEALEATLDADALARALDGKAEGGGGEGSDVEG